MNAANWFTNENLSDDKLASKLDWFCTKEQISEYDESKHKKLEYWPDFIYVNDKKNNKIYVIKWVDLSMYEEIKKTLNDEDFDIFCFSKTKTWTTYNSFKPSAWWVVLEMKPLILDI